MSKKASKGANVLLRLYRALKRRLTESPDKRAMREIKRLVDEHPEYGQKRLLRELSQKGLEIDPLELRRLLRRWQKSKGQIWLESPLDPETWRHPPPRYMA